MICPIKLVDHQHLNYDCYKERCAWYVKYKEEEKGDCLIKVFVAKDLGNVE